MTNLINDPSYSHEGTSNWEAYWYGVGLHMTPRLGPIQLDIETNTGCNSKCKKCTEYTSPLPHVRMDFEDIKNLIDGGDEYDLRSIKHNYRGEPLLYEDVEDLWSYAKRKKLFVHFNTNGLLLSVPQINSLIRNRVDEILITIDTSKPEVYKELTGHLGFETLKERLTILQILKQFYDTKKPVVRVQAVIQPENKDEIESGEYEKFWRSFADQIGFMDMFDLLDNTPNQTELPKWHCEQLWQRLIILVDGTVLPCCCGIDLAEGKIYSVGNIFDNTIREIWNSPRLRHMRAMHKEGKSHAIEMCRKCRLRKYVINNWEAKNAKD